ncbi:MAG: MBL fold metallo-hydrolase [Acidimicrobiia bacterium]|nr:MBL fold metallo-hydrolase [Acidimicrobiia bacterium]
MPAIQVLVPSSLRFGRRPFLDRARRYALGGLAAGAAAGAFGVRDRAFGAAVAAQTPSNQPRDITPPTITKLRENLYSIGGADAEHRSSWTGGSNLVFVTRNHGVVLVDTKNPGWGRHMQTLIRSVTDKPVTTIVITHTHYDHTASNIEFPDTVDFVAHVNCVRSMSQASCNRTTGCEYFQGENARYLPKITFRDRHTLFEGDDRVDLYYFGPAHTDGDAIVHIPSLNAMHPGDIYPGRYSPFIDTINGGSGVGYDTVLTQMVKTFANVDIMLPAHRDTPEPWARLQEYAAWWTSFVGYVRDGQKAGRSPQELADEYRLPPEFPGVGLNTLGAPTRLHINTGVIFDEVKGS